MYSIFSKSKRGKFIILDRVKSLSFNIGSATTTSYTTQ